jgi:integrase
VKELRAAQTQSSALSPAVIEFLVLTAARENEVCGIEVVRDSMGRQTLVLPASRSKTGKEHRVPLSDRALALLVRQRGPKALGQDPDIGAFIWPGRSGYEPITGKSVYIYLTQTMGVKATIHGLRSSFRDWAGDTTHFARDHIEECLGHTVGNAVERAYRRTDALEKRRVVLQAWSEFCQS